MLDFNSNIVPLSLKCSVAIPVAFHLTLSFSRLNTFKCSIVRCSHFKVGGKKGHWRKGKRQYWGFKWKWSPWDVLLLRGFCQLCCLSIFSWLRFTFYLICFQNHFPFLHVRSVTWQIMLHVPSRWGEVKVDPQDVCTCSSVAYSCRTAVPFSHTTQFHSFQMIFPLANFWSNKYFHLQHVFVTGTILTDQCYEALISAWCFKILIHPCLTCTSGLSCYFPCHLHPLLHNDEAMHFISFFFFLNSTSVHLQMI